MSEPLTSYYTCPLCEATCGLEVTTRDERVVAVRGDAQDVFSHGFICPKGAELGALHDDPDRLRTPLVRAPGGRLEPAGWDEAFARIDAGLSPILAADRNAVATYLGNPNVHNLANQVYAGSVVRAINSRNAFSASSVDQFPKQMACALMFGTGTSVPVPDVDRTEHLLILGANPLASNGSLLTAPDMRGRLRAIRGRGGRIVVVDPRRTRTAREADEHVFIRPGTDAHLLFALVHVLFAEGLVSPGRLAEWTEGIERVAELARAFAPAAVAPVCGIEPVRIERMARELAGAGRAAVYGRMGTCTQTFGTLASWLVDVLNVLTGNLDRAGGAMFPKAAAGHRNAAGAPGSGRGARFGRWHSRVRGLGELFGELPVACLAEEIDTPGEGRVRALITVCGNPALSTPNAARLERALESLDFMVSLDVYLNETTRHADVVLPAPAPLHRGHYDLALYMFAARNVANYSPPVFAPDPLVPDESVTLLRLIGVLSGRGPDADVTALDDLLAGVLVGREIAQPGSPIEGWPAERVLGALAPRRGPERILDLLLRAGPYGDGFDPERGGLSLAVLEANPHGVDLGPLEPRIPELLRTPSGRIELAPELLVGDVARLRAKLSTRAARDTMVLVGRRELRSNNSWMHNVPGLVRGPARCTAHVHPDDAARLGLVAGASARVRSRTGEITVPIEITGDVMPGVVSIPHGWGHGVDGTALAVAGAHPGANSNALADEQLVDAVSGNAVLNGIPVELEQVAVSAEVAVGAA